MSQDNQNNAEEPSVDSDSKDPRVARREKMRQIVAKGIDPFGSRYDDRTMMGR